MRYEKSCGAIVYRIKGYEVEYLLLKSARKSGHWGFAKGHMEALETEEETCIREVFEESGIKIQIEPGFRVSDQYMAAEDINKQVVMFLASAGVQQVHIQEEEISDYKWCSYEDALDLLTFEGSREMLIKANNHLE